VPLRAESGEVSFYQKKIEGTSSMAACDYVYPNARNMSTLDFDNFYARFLAKRLLTFHADFLLLRRGRRALHPQSARIRKIGSSAFLWSTFSSATMANRAMRVLWMKAECRHMDML
jgi:hypothetical protein